MALSWASMTAMWETVAVLLGKVLIIGFGVRLIPETMDHGLDLVRVMHG